jgi:hypothetical protein
MEQKQNQLQFRKGFRVGSIEQARYVAGMIEQSKQKAIGNMVDKKTQEVKNAFPARTTSSFLPTDTGDHAMLEVMTRQSFLDFVFRFWFNEKKFKVFALIASGLTLVTFSINPLISGVFAMASGYYFMKHAHMNFIMDNLVKKRTLMQTV